MIADTPDGFNVFVAAGWVRVTDGCDVDDPSVEEARAVSAVETIQAPGWREDCP